jgi:hypothetical protein
VDRDGRVIETFHNQYDSLIFTNWKPDGSVMDDRYVYRYKHLGNGEVVERTQEEMNADYVASNAVNKNILTADEANEILNKEE